MSRAGAAWVVAAVAAGAAWLIVGAGFANYDTAYALVWGRELAHGQLPDYAVALAPTPHPLATLFGLVLAPLGSGAETAWVVVAFLALGAVAGLCFALGSWAFGPAAGLLAAAIAITREPLLSYGIRAYVDLPYVAFVLWALLALVRRPLDGRRVLVPLGLAGLLRPEAWLLSGAYVAYRLWAGERARRTLLWLLALAAAAPLVWLLADLVVTGNPLHSLTGTRDTARELDRRTGLGALPSTVPRRLGEIVREPVLVGAVVGGVLGLRLLPRRTLPLAAAGVVALVAFSVLAGAGLPILGRYLMFPALLLVIACAAGALGWTRLAPGHPWRRRWQLAGAAVAILLLAFAPAQAARLDDLRATMGEQAAIHDDLRALARTMPASCLPVGVADHQPVPLLALWLDAAPGRVVVPAATPQAAGQYVAPASPAVARAFQLDPDAPVAARGAPPGFSPGGRSRDWVRYARCGGAPAGAALADAGARR